MNSLATKILNNIKHPIMQQANLDTADHTAILLDLSGKVFPPLPLNYIVDSIRNDEKQAKRKRVTFFFD